MCGHGGNVVCGHYKNSQNFYHFVQFWFLGFMILVMTAIYRIFNKFQLMFEFPRYSMSQSIFISIVNLTDRGTGRDQLIWQTLPDILPFFQGVWHDFQLCQTQCPAWFPTYPCFEKYKYNKNESTTMDFHGNHPSKKKYWLCMGSSVNVCQILLRCRTHVQHTQTC